MCLQPVCSGWNLHRHGEQLRVSLPSTVDGQDLPDRYIPPNDAFRLYIGPFVYLMFNITDEMCGPILNVCVLNPSLHVG